MAGERKFAGLFVDAEAGEVVGALVATVQEIAGGIEIEAAGVIATGGFFAQIGEFSGGRGATRPTGIDGENCDAVVEAVAGVEKFAVVGNENFGGEAAAGKMGWQRADGLTLGELAGLRIEVEERNGRAFFLDGVEPAGVWVEREMARAVAWGKFDERRIVGDECTFFGVEFPHEDFVEGVVGVEDELPGWIGLDHVTVGAVVAADGEAAGRCVSGVGRADFAGVGFDIGGIRKGTVGLNWKNGDGAAEIVCDEEKFSGWMHANVSGARPAAGDGVEESQAAVWHDLEGTDSSFFFVADTVGFVGGIEMCSGFV